MNLTRRIWLSILLTIVTVGSVLAMGSRPQPVPLAKLTLQPGDLPPDAEWKGAGPVSVSDLSQPLNDTNGAGLAESIRGVAFAYQESYAMQALTSAAYIANYAYRYADPAGATATTAALLDTIRQRHGGTVLQVGRDEWAATFKGPEGDAVYWYARAKDQDLILLIVDGMPTSDTQQLFETLASRLRKR